MKIHIFYFPSFPLGVHALPPGCTSITCAHQRAVEYYAESVYPGNENNFPSIQCNSLNADDTTYCSDKTVPMGFAAPSTLKGNYFLRTNEESPFGKNATTSFICHNEIPA